VSEIYVTDLQKVTSVSQSDTVLNLICVPSNHIYRIGRNFQSVFRGLSFKRIRMFHGAAKICNRFFYFYLSFSYRTYVTERWQSWMSEASALRRLLAVTYINNCHARYQLYINLYFQRGEKWCYENQVFYIFFLGVYIKNEWSKINLPG
jgi:hypothetical protein